MIKSQYDSSCLTWFPKGEIIQIEYATNAVKQGSLCLALRSKSHAIVCTIKRNPTELACYQEKVFKISDSMGMAISGLTADARVLCKYMRRESLSHLQIYGCEIPPKLLINKVADKCADKTIKGGRPFGIGLLVVCVDGNGNPHVYETRPSGEYFEYFGYSIGDKSQSSRTYLENNMNKYADCDLHT
jgi:20S proteasome subunit alpha 6